MLAVPDKMWVRMFRHQVFVPFRFHICDPVIPTLLDDSPTYKWLSLDRSVPSGDASLINYLFVEHYVDSFDIPKEDWENCQIRFNLSATADTFTPLTLP